jgi:elongation factor Ts
LTFVARMKLTWKHRLKSPQPNKELQMEISANLVKDLREKTGAGMMDCKKALVATSGNFEEAIDFLRKGMASAANQAGRATKEGAVVALMQGEGTAGVLLEVNCETDFVARTEQFKAFTRELCNHILKNKPATVEALMGQNGSSGKTIQVMLQETIAQLGENMGIRRFERSRCFLQWGWHGEFVYSR